jgi:2-methylisocitrate lyase-like PEP mutase family enzyme
VPRAEALARVRAAVEARDEGAGVLVMARTDARAPAGLEEALWRGRAFADLGADIVFVEAPRSEQEMERVCREIPGPKMANLVEDGDTPLLPPERLEAMGYKIAAHPLTLLLAAAHAMRRALAQLKSGEAPTERLRFEALRELVGFPAYDRALRRYTSE